MCVSSKLEISLNFLLLHTISEVLIRSINDVLAHVCVNYVHLATYTVPRKCLDVPRDTALDVHTINIIRRAMKELLL